MKDVIICDIDGTLADASHRLHHIQSKPKNWDAFFAGVVNDAPHHDIAELVACFRDAYSCIQPRVILVSGRPERTRNDTMRWLHAQLDWIHGEEYDGLFMRADGDRRADDIVKEEILDQHLIPNQITPDTTLAVFDDRDRVVAMWRRRGFRVLQVAPGDF